MYNFIKFVAIIFLALTLINHYSLMFVTIYLKGFLIVCIIACLLLLAYAMLKNLKNN
jgi:hypothetical protein